MSFGHYTIHDYQRHHGRSNYQVSSGESMPCMPSLESRSLSPRSTRRAKMALIVLQMRCIRDLDGPCVRCRKSRRSCLTTTQAGTANSGRTLSPARAPSAPPTRLSWIPSMDASHNTVALDTPVCPELVSIYSTSPYANHLDHANESSHMVTLSSGDVAVSSPFSDQKGRLKPSDLSMSDTDEVIQL
jgi:hypothetical protein